MSTQSASLAGSRWVSRRRLMFYAGAGLAILIGIAVFIAASSREAGGIVLVLCVAIGAILAYKAAPMRIVQTARERVVEEGLGCAYEAEQLRDRGRSEEAATYAGKAIAHFEEVLDVDPTCALALAGQGRCLALLGRTSEGAAALEAAIALTPQPDNFNSHYYLGLCQLELGDLSAARESIGRTIYRPDHAREASLGVCKYGERVVGAAAQAQARGDRAAERTEYLKAAEAFDLALEFDPANKRAQRARDDAREALKKLG